MMVSGIGCADWGDSPVEGTGESLSQTLPVTTQPQGDTPYPVIANIVELRDFLYKSIQNGEYEPIFHYTGDQKDLSAQTIARILSAYYIRVRKLLQGENNWQVLYTPYSGERMVAAYRSGDSTQLSADEADALKLAIEVVEQGKAQSANALELELYLHDWLCDRVTYYDGDATVDSHSHLVRHLTAVGALLDGKANCQGYTDGFYALAAIAGFDVGKQSALTDEGGHSFNTIRMDGKWYVVDVTFNDDTYLDDDCSYRDYRLFNAGIDDCAEYTWPEEYQCVPLERESGQMYYYHFTEENSAKLGYRKSYEDLYSMAEGIAALWRTGKGSAFHMMLRGGRTSSKDLQSALELFGIYRSDSIWALKVGENTYYYVRLD